MDIQVSCRDPHIRTILERHPHVDLTEGGPAHLEISQNGWQRRLFCGNADCKLYGLPEIMDNNPLVCADEASTLGPAATLLMIAMGPLIRAGILAESPVFICTDDASSEELDQALFREHWTEGVSFRHESDPQLDSVCAGALIASVQGIGEPVQIKELFDEWYAPKFFVKSGLGEEWTPALVRDTPFAYYKPSVTIDGDAALVKVQVRADRFGKCGAAQMVHMMNIMCGFEESLPFE